MCVVMGGVSRIDGSLMPYATVTFNSMVQQIVNGQTLQPFLVSRDTDDAGNLTAVSLVQGMAMQVLVSDGGVTYPATTVMIQRMPSACRRTVRTSTGT